VVLGAHDVSRARLLSHVSFLFYLYGDHRDLHSFPTRRSSDLLVHKNAQALQIHAGGHIGTQVLKIRPPLEQSSNRPVGFPKDLRSEEHTSELQSRENLVCRLLLEKKKNKSHRRRSPASSRTAC